MKSEQKLKMVSTGNSLFPVAVKADKIDFDRGVFDKIFLVTDRRRLF